MTTFNAFGSSAKDFGKVSKPVWLGTPKPHAVGGVLASAYAKAGAYYPAGTPVKLDAGVITPAIMFEVTAFSAGDGTSVTVDTITIKPFAGSALPAVGDFIMKLGANFTSTGKAAEVAGVTENAVTAGTYDVTVSHAATVDTPSAGDVIVFSSAVAAGSSKSVAAVPNGYLYNDIYLGDLSSPAASGAVIDFHGEGILIDLTPGAACAAKLATAIPSVVQVKFPASAFVE